MQHVRPRGPLSAAIVLLWLGVAGLPVRAQGSGDREGIDVGRWKLIPQLRTSVAFRDNIFRSSGSRLNRENGVVVPDPTVDDFVSSIGTRLAAQLPFRNSRLRFDYQASKDSYADTEFTRDTKQELQGRVEFNFETGDRLALTERFTQDFAQVREASIEAGNVAAEEDIFSGEPFSLNHWEIELSRNEANRQGYAMRISRQDFNYTGDKAVGLDDFRGFDSSFEYRQPLPGNRWAIAYLGSRRFNYYNNFGLVRRPPGTGPCTAPDPRLGCFVPVRLDPVGVPSRAEETDTLQLGLRGELGPGQQFLVRLGLGSSTFTDFSRQFTSEFKGVSGYARWGTPLGPRNSFELSLSRRPLPSNFETYYVDNEVRGEFRRELARNSTVSLSLALGRNAYGDIVDFCSTTALRQDDRLDLRGSGNWWIHPRFGFHLSADYSRRESNCTVIEDEGDYTATAIEAGVLLGWF